MTTAPDPESSLHFGRLLGEALERRGFALPTGSAMAASEMSAVAKDFLRAAREAGADEPSFVRDSSELAN